MFIINHEDKESLAELTKIACDVISYRSQTNGCFLSQY